MIKRIMIIANNSNGLYLFRKEVIAALVNKGFQVAAMTPFDDNVDKLRGLGIELIETRIDRRGTNPFKDISLINTYKKQIKKFKPDLVITYTIKPNVYGGLVCKRLHVDYCANITGLGTAFEKGGVLRKIAVLLNKASLNKAKAVFFENSANQKVYIDEKIIRRDQACLLNGAGVNLDHFGFCPYPEDEGETRFLFIGRIMKEKGIEELLEALHELRNDGAKVSLDVLGFFEEDYSSSFEKYASEGWLRYHGQQADVRPFIEQCHCFVLPSYHEGMANTNLESAASGRPVITSNIPGCMEAVVDKKSGFLCKPKDVKSLKNAMSSFISLTLTERRCMGLAGRKHMEANFDKEIVVNRTLDIALK